MKVFLSLCVRVLPLSVSVLIVYVYFKRPEPATETTSSTPKPYTEEFGSRSKAASSTSSPLDALRRELEEVRLEMQANPQPQTSATLKEAAHESDPRTIGAKTADVSTPGVSKIITSGKTEGSQIIAEKYVRAIHLHQWEIAAGMVATESLERLKWFQRAHLYQAPTIQAEQELLQLLRIKDVSDIDQLSPREVFIRRGQAQTSRLPNPNDYLKEIGKNVVLESLGAVPEDGTVHLIIRKEFVAKGKVYSELAFISVIKENGDWKISLDAQEPVIKEIGKHRR
ncbi:MAG: hypothetical protein ACI8T1_001487 [Verrucomicrobiales bacterium]|jgi:hypothetical protein